MPRSKVILTAEKVFYNIDAIVEWHSERGINYLSSHPTIEDLIFELFSTDVAFTFANDSVAMEFKLSFG